ncbi:MAG TPA: flagellar hook-associated protein FlgL [Mobilitalea sp.]|nr:flagellar hook-associated protein FlgL [Mobilitalea sp.]
MRITNKMMTNNMMNNINKNKFNMTTLEQQYSSGKKIQKPSDDPIIAVRALKLRTSLSELEQYYDKNIPDAMSWMDVTESALKTVNDILRQVNTYCVQGSTDTLNATDRSSIVQNLTEMKNQIYQEGNTNYAGRYVFTGYKTDSPLIFTKDTNNLSYDITESISGEEIQVGSRVTGSYKMSDYDNPGETFMKPPTLVDTYRIQLSYGELKEKDIESIEYSLPVAGGDPIEQTPFKNIDTISSIDPLAYQPDADEIHFINETGELILGADVYELLRTATDIRIPYTKNNFSNGDLKPEHYFSCKMTDSDKPEQGEIPFVKNPKNPQQIQYEVNYNQKLTINTEGSDAITHSIGRSIEDILNSVDEVIATEGMIAEVKKRLEDTSLEENSKLKYEKMLEQLDTDLELKKEVMQNAFEKGITDSGKEQDRVNVAVADLGSRYTRLELTENRLSSQKVDFNTLLSTNEDVDIVDTIIKYDSAQTIYNASLSAASKIVKNSLLDFL